MNNEEATEARWTIAEIFQNDQVAHDKKMEKFMVTTQDMLK